MPAPRTARRWPTVLLRALAGLAGLAFLLVGIPAALLQFGQLPDAAPSIGDALDALSAPDDGTLLLTTITLIGWAVWLWLAVPVLLEAMAVVVRRSSPKIPGFATPQRIAGFLLGSILLASPAAAAAAAPAAAATTASAPHHTTGTDTPTASTSTSRAEEWPTYRATADDIALWDVAEKLFGEGGGPRWKDIAALNPDLDPKADLQAGTVLNVPTDARIPSQDQATTSTSKADKADKGDDADHAVTVKPGDSLSTIADDELDDPAAWPKIYNLNRGTIDDPNLIYPGQHLKLPTTATPPAEKTPRPEDKAPDHTEDKPTPDSASPAPTHTPKTNHPTTPAPSASTLRTHQPDAPQTNDQPADHDSQILTPSTALALAGAGILAASTIGIIATRRKLQQRRRRPGRRIPLPQARAATTEQTLRTVQNPTGVELLDTALRTLAANLATDDRDLPEIEAAVLRPTGIDLHLAEAAPACAPFTADPAQPTLWRCPADTPALLRDDQLADTDPPYPGLVSIGWDDDGGLVLIDLEAIGILHITGDPDRCRAVLRALAIELATSALVPHLEVTAVGTAAEELETAVPERVARIQHLGQALTSLSAHDADQRRALQTAGAPSLRAARLMATADGAWTPRILLCGDDTAADDEDLAALIEALSERPRTSSAVITTIDGVMPTTPAGWTLTTEDADTPVTLPGPGIPITLQTLSDTDYADILTILTTAGSDTDTPAPAWTQPTPSPTADPDTTEPAPRDDESSASEPPVAQPPSGPTLSDILGEPDAGTEEPADAPPAAPPAQAKLTHATASTAPRITIHAQADEAPEPSPLPPAPTAPGPTIRVLGPVDIQHAAGRVDTNRQKTCTELAAYLILNPGVDHNAVDQALWPDRRVTKSTRAPLISRLRSWLGDSTDGTPHFPRVTDDAKHRYTLGPHVTSDWTQFQELYRAGMHDTGEDADLALRQALALVRDRPFAATDPRRYTWAEPWIQEMTSAIVDTAHELATRRLAAHDPRSALWAATKGLNAAEEDELLHRDVFLAHHAAGDMEALRLAAARLEALNEELDVDMDTETASLLRTLLPRAAASSRA
ncbi:LysM peptidoglycan-binding domain-containing protein [Streptomyces sp. NPDC007875]|uniref:LysM peptidoglycan-binding domain-containing protein n=1 Tax=Streptomyces sp. NPDC007875 TaxID=3364783 RepID=UPI003677251F